MGAEVLRDDDLPPTLVISHLDGLRADETIRPSTHDRLLGAGVRLRLDSLPQIVDDDPVSVAEFTRIDALGTGGNGVVERAHQRSVGREVAIKRVRDPSMPGAAEMLLEEGRVMGLLEHPSIVPVLALGRDAHGQPVLVMKRVEGTTWRALLRDPAHPEWRQHPGDALEFHLRVLARVADVAHYAHAHSWLHRDIKPDNVMVGSRGDVYLIDWGLAVHLPVELVDGGGDLVGTPGYMAPEMIEGAGPWLSPRTDVYLLGAALHEVLTGETRHVGTNLRAVLTSAWLSPPYEYPPSTPAELATLAAEATCALPEERPASAELFKQRIEGYLSHRAALAAVAEGRARFDHLCALAERGHVDEIELSQRLDGCLAVLRRSLERWPASPEALDTLTEVLTWRVRRSVARGDLLAAKTTLTELPSADPALEAEVSAAAARLGDERLRYALLGGLGRPHDPRQWAQGRARAARIGAATGGGSLLALGAAEHATALTMSWPVISVAAVVALGFAVAAAGDDLVRVGRVDWAPRREMVWLLGGVLALIVAGRVVGVTPGQALALVPVFGGVGAGLLTGVVGRARRGLVAVCAVGAVLAPVALRLGPAYVLDVVALTTIAAHLVIERAWRRVAEELVPTP